MRHVLFCLAVLIAAPPDAGAQPAGAILPDANRGDRLIVTTVSGARFSGRLVSDGGGALVLGASDGERAIAHTAIDRVTRRHNRFLFGPLIGLGAGLAVGLPAKTRFENEAADGNAVLAWSVGTGVAIGALIDLVNGSDRTIYSRRPAAVSAVQFQPGHRGATVRWAIAW